MSHQAVQLAGDTLLEMFESDSMRKQAVDALNDFTRTQMREDGFYRRVLPMLPVQNSDLDKQMDTPKPCKIFEKEPDSPAAAGFAFASLPNSFYIHGPRYRATFARILTERAQVDVDELRTWTMDIRQVISDNQAKDMLAEEDSKFISAVNTCLVGLDSTVPFSGVVQWKSVAGGVTRENFAEALKIMPRIPSRFEAVTGLLNNITIKEVIKFPRNEIGGDYSEQLFKHGWGETEIMGLTIIVTIKQNLVPDNRMYMFADPKTIGKSLSLEEAALYVKREAYMLEWFMYETIGGSIGHTGGLAAVTWT